MGADVATARMVLNASDEEAVKQGMRYDHASADRVKFFFKRFLRHSKGEFAGKPFELLEWQFERILAPLYGWLRRDGTRRFRRAYIEVPKKNGKSTMCAGLSLHGLVGDGEPGAEVYSAAADRDQASIVYDEAANMVEASPALSDRVKVLRSKKLLKFLERKSVYKALSADVPTKEGLNISLLVFDELHAQKTRELWDTLRYGGAARRQPLLVAITTAGYDKQSICWEQHCYAKGVIDGKIVDPTFFGFITALPEGADWTDPEAQAIANPSWGVTINPVEMAEATREAQQSPVQENTFKRYRLNLWTEQDVRWLSTEKWDACSSGPVDLEELQGEECFCGLDLASTTDLAAFCAWFPRAHKLICMFWAPEEADKTRERLGRARLEAWIDADIIKVTEGSVIDYDVIRADINDFAESFEIKQIAIDRWNSTQLQTQLMGDGFDIVQYGQGFASMAAPMKELDKLVTSGKLDHGNNPVLRWMAGNLAVETDAAGNMKPSKKKSGDKIDGMVATVMALGIANLDEGDGGESVYEGRGLESA